MSRTLGGPLASHIGTNTHTRCSMVRLDLQDGTFLAVTDHNNDISFNFGDGSHTYSAGTGILPSDLSLSVGFEPSDIEVQGPIGDTVSRVAVKGGRYDDATARLFQVNWNSLGSGPIRLLNGRVVLAEVLGGRFKFTIHGESSRFAQTIGRVITAYCDADFGDARCNAVPVEDAVTVTAVTDERQFTVTNPSARVDNFYKRGTVYNWTGGLAGIRPVEILGWTAAGVVTLWAPLPEPPTIGDGLVLRQGCYDITTNTSKTRAACMAFDNIINFRGFPDAPGTDQVLRYPNPGAA